MSYAQNTLEDVSYNTAAGGAVEVVLRMDAPISGDPRVFTTETPPRIAIDLSNTRSGLSERTVPIGQGATRSVTAVEAAGRTRVVIDLFRNVPYEMRTQDNLLIVDIAGGVEVAGVVGVEESTVLASASNDVARASVAKVDFRRGRDGEGKVLVFLNGTPSGSDMTQRGDRIRVELFDTMIPAELEQQLDVVDFATPVDLIDVYNEAGRAILSILAAGDYESLAYQADNQFVVEVHPVVEDIEESAGSLLEPPEYTGERVTFTFQDIPVRAVLQLIADVSQLNIVVSDAVRGNVTLRLNNVPWDQALDLILQSKQLDRRQNGNVVWVAPANEIAAYEQQQLQALVQKEELEPVRSDFIQVNYAKASDLAGLLQSGSGDRIGLLSARGAVSVDERTNTLLVSDTSTKLREIRELVALLDRPVRQVQIESRIVIASSDFTRDLGVRFGLTATQEDSHGNIYSTSGTLTALDRMNNRSISNRLQGRPSGLPNITPGVPPNGIQGPPLSERLNVNLPINNAAGSFGWTILASDYLLDLEISALEEEGRGEVISSPRLIAANQEEAYIQQGVEIPFQQATSSGATAIAFKDAVLELRAVPLITPDNRIQLDLTVKQDTVGAEVPTGLGGTVPTIDKREIDTKVLVDNGQTIVLGGIYEQELRDSVNKVPFLGDLPALGTLFRQRLREFDKAELLIFVTPTILQENY